MSLHGQRSLNCRQLCASCKPSVFDRLLPTSG